MMSDDLVKLEWDIRSGGGASTHLPFGSYFVEEYQFSGWQWSYCFCEYYDEGSYSCKDTADGMSLAEEHWRKRVRPITKPLTDRIEQLVATNEELEAKQKKAAQYFAEIILHCANSGRGVPLIDERIIERCEDIATNAIEELTGGKDE